MSLRSQLLPCDPGCALERHITTLVRTLCRPHSKSPSQLALLAMLVLGLDWQSIALLPLWTQAPHRFPRQGKSFRGVDEQHNTSKLWCYTEQFALQRWHQVAHSQVHKGLTALLPPVHFYLLLPLPEVLRQLIDGQRLRPNLQQELALICKRYRLTLTLAQLNRYLSQWLKRSKVDEAVNGLLRGKTAQQCAPLAYSHLECEQVLTVWRDYLGHLGLEVGPTAAPPPVYTALGSRLFPYRSHLNTLLVRHTLLILNLATGARPVTDMYGNRHSYRSADGDDPDRE